MAEASDSAASGVGDVASTAESTFEVDPSENLASASAVGDKTQPGSEDEGGDCFATNMDLLFFELSGV